MHELDIKNPHVRDAVYYLGFFSKKKKSKKHLKETRRARAGRRSRSKTAKRSTPSSL